MTTKKTSNKQNLEALEKRVTEMATAAKGRIDAARQLDRLMPEQFQKNLKAFEKHMPEIHKQFKDYKSDKLKMFATASGVINVVESSTGIPLYGEDPLKECHEQVEQFFKKPFRSEITFTSNEKNPENFIHVEYMNRIYGLYEEASEVLEPLETLPKRVGTLFVFGSGLGYHIEELIEKLTIENLYIIEPNNDVFYASLYTADWFRILEKVDKDNTHIVLNIGVEYKDITNDLFNDLHEKGSYHACASYLYLHYQTENIRKLINQVSEDFAVLGAGWGFFDDSVLSLAHTYHSLKRDIPFMKNGTDLSKEFPDTPVFLIANGPSLDTCIEHIRAHQDNAIVISMGTAITSLVKYGIVPDFHVELERTKLTFDVLNNYVDHEILKKVNLLTVNLLHPACHDLFAWSGCGLKMGEPCVSLINANFDRDIKFRYFYYCNPLVANTGMVISQYLGFDDIYLFGVDNGYRDRGNHHSKASAYYQKSKKGETLHAGDTVSTNEFEVPGNFGGKIITNRTLDTCRYFLEQAIQSEPARHRYNCSDGALLRGTYPVNPDDILLTRPLNKKPIIDWIKKSAFVSSGITAEEYMNVVNIPLFEEVCDVLLDQIKGPFKNRDKLTEALYHQSNYVNSFYKTKNRHIYFVFNGTISYVHAVLRLFIFSFKEEKKMLEYTDKALELWRGYIEDAKKKYAKMLDYVEFE
ncbi:DUF115 domain-containing protein [Aliiglaciecola sp. CAU 1673]|uniref:motility associated factor glycosyltransferase family protein n=1 Tax=Aliiglaciecola sp. CAU 1673 TaxID=3032595 RepID=UPI0023DA9180|nr:6-hydroxymethylpterin diphosphokinase MptE-like protein [Aliiglaciecola sp. CAU 1673]MDF2178310.1 DUF115 domain-containing protein [Aliiglaciecola sp. CAU 1673]